MADPRDSLDADLTQAGKLKPVAKDERSLGDQSTANDVGSSVSDLNAIVDDIGDLGEVIDLTERYEIQEELGHGGMGRVFKAFDRRLKRTVAIKRLKDEISSSRKAMQRFMTEAQSIASLNHFNIVHIYDFGRDNEGPFLILEYVEGQTLADKIRDGAIELEYAVTLTLQLCGGLETAHRRGIIHRDIKPANILLTADGRPKLTDFGLARQEHTDFTQTQTGAVLGTFDYMPPEQRRDVTATDARSDLWSLGATFYQMVTAEVPRVINIDALPLKTRDIVSRVLKTNPDERYATAGDFAQALRDAHLNVSRPPDFVAEGQCRGCGVVNNASRKFCRDCGDSLREPCLSCTEEIGPWEKFCPECGADLNDLEQQRLAEIEATREKVELLRTEQRHEDAMAALDELKQQQNHRRIAPHLTWIQSVRDALAAEQKQLTERVQDLTAQAAEALADHQYSRAIQSLNGIPDAYHTDETRELRQDASRKKQEADGLRKAIREQLKVKEYAGLLQKVDRYLQLRPGNSKLLELRPDLEAWEANRRGTESPQPQKQASADSSATATADQFVNLRNRRKGVFFIVSYFLCSSFLLLAAYVVFAAVSLILL